MSLVSNNGLPFRHHCIEQNLIRNDAVRVTVAFPPYVEKSEIVNISKYFLLDI